MLKRILFFSIIVLSVGCGVVRDNPVDKNGDNYESPSFNISLSNIESDKICYDSLLSVTVEGNSEFNIYEFYLDGNVISSWNDSGILNVAAGKVGTHILKIKTKYANGIESDSLSLKYFVLPKTSVFISPQWIDTTGGEVVYLNTWNLLDTVTSMHVEISNARIDSVELVDSVGTNYNILFDSTTIDIANLPGSSPITGTTNMLAIYLNGFINNTLDISVILRDKNNEDLVVDSVIGALYEN